MYITEHVYASPSLNGLRLSPFFSQNDHSFCILLAPLDIISKST